MVAADAGGAARHSAALPPPLCALPCTLAGHARAAERGEEELAVGDGQQVVENRVDGRADVEQHVGQHVEVVVEVIQVSMATGPPINTLPNIYQLEQLLLNHSYSTFYSSVCGSTCV